MSFDHMPPPDPDNVPQGDPVPFPSLDPPPITLSSNPLAHVPGIIDAVARLTHGHHDRHTIHVVRLIEVLGVDGYHRLLADRRAHDLKATSVIFDGLDDLIKKVADHGKETLRPADWADVTPDAATQAPTSSDPGDSADA